MTTRDRVALITGASRGIGAATARRLATDGATVVLAARSGDQLRTVANDIEETTDGAAHAVPTDVTDPDAVQALVETTLERFGRLDAVVVNAGTGERRNVPLTELSLDEYRTVRATNIDGAFYTTRAVLDPLRETTGSLVFVGSYKGKYPSTSTPIYAASKWWLRGFAQSVAGRVGPDGVAVSLVNPTGVTTSFGRETREQPNSELLADDDALSAADVAETIVTALDQDAPGAITELDLFRRDIYERF
ncbi:SDR family oxidoreductase [Salinibaculum rarum]|uniref:SDR family oxidoreductase n=1 Tax=Salinibaculum rarum TaxID=3058903 RepID=UPI00265FC1DC|nr:SDR family oxidoreductase [Salinibaculum sp. KK48]